MASVFFRAPPLESAGVRMAGRIVMVHELQRCAVFGHLLLLPPCIHAASVFAKQHPWHQCRTTGRCDPASTCRCKVARSVAVAGPTPKSILWWSGDRYSSVCRSNANLLRADQMAMAEPKVAIDDQRPWIYGNPAVYWGRAVGLGLVSGSKARSWRDGFARGRGQLRR